jgi:hypothetical protein
MSEANASDKTQSYDTRVALQVLLDSLETMRNAVEGAPIERQIEIGSILWEIGDLVKEDLDEIKAAVRQVAVKELNGQVGNTTLEGDDRGEATVTIPTTTLKIPKGKDIDGIKQALGSRFPFFFDTVTTHKPVKEFEDRVEAVTDPLEQKILVEAIERKEMTPRVSFKRHKPSKRDTDGDK